MGITGKHIKLKLDQVEAVLFEENFELDSSGLQDDSNENT